MGSKLDKLRALAKSKRGRNLITFLIFLGLSAMLWVVQVLNEDSQRDLRCVVRITHVPDSLTRVSPIPEAVNVSVRARGTQLLRFMWSSAPVINIDFRTYKTDNRISFGQAAFRSFFRNTIGGDAQVLSVSPDTLSIYFTSRPGVEVPVKVDANVIPGPQFAIIGKVRSLTDSVMAYSVDGVSTKLRSVSTAPIVLNDLRSSRTIRVPLKAPHNTRLIPDSVDVRIEVEPLISKTRNVPVTITGVPDGLRVVPVPAHVEVYYMVPMSVYKRTAAEPHFVVEAEYEDIAANPSAEAIPLTLKSVPHDFMNVFLAADSVEFIIERK